MSKSFSRSACARRSWTRSQSAESLRRFRSSELVASGRARRAATCSASRRPARARRSPSGSRSSSVPAAAATPAALVLVPTRELAAQVTEELAPSAAAGLRVAAVYGGMPLGTPGEAARGAEILVATPGRLKDLVERRLVSLGQSRSSSSTRPTGCSTWASGRRSTRSSAACRRTARRCSSRPRSTARSASWRAPTRRSRRASSAPPEPDGEALSVDHAFVAVTADDKLDRLVDISRTPRARPRLRADEARRRPPGQAAVAAGRAGGGDARRHAAGARASGHSSVPLRPGADTGRDRTRRPRPRPRRDHERHQLRSARGRHELPAPRRPNRPCRPRRSGVTFVLPEQQADVSRIAIRAGRRAEFEHAGLRPARPKLLYTSRRGAPLRSGKGGTRLVLGVHEHRSLIQIVVTRVAGPAASEVDDLASKGLDGFVARLRCLVELRRGEGTSDKPVGPPYTVPLDLGQVAGLIR